VIDTTTPIPDHPVHRLCPNCGVAIFPPVVWAFSAGMFACDCGFRVPPRKAVGLQ
jgi:predicted RNA-binding Zn-ribbon protein involved in translation (DUF1610 family)